MLSDRSEEAAGKLRKVSVAFSCDGRSVETARKRRRVVGVKSRKLMLVKGFERRASGWF